MTTHKSALAWLAALFVSVGSSSLPAQTNATQTNAAPGQPQADVDIAVAGPTSENPNETPILMSAFRVNTTQDTGYVDSHSATAFKTDQALITIPQPVLVITRDLIADTGYYIASDILQFAGVGDYYRGETYVIRGARVSYNLVDDMQGIMPHADAVYVDSFEVIKGPSSVFYPNASLGGIVLKTTRKPMTTEQNSISVSIDGFGSRRVELDSTGPIEKVGDGVLAYRLIVADQGGPTYFNNIPNTVQALHPSIQFTDSKNKFLVAFDYQKFIFLDNAQGIMSPDGAMYTGQGGWKEEENNPPGINVTHRWIAVFFEYEHAMSDNWALKMSGAVQDYRFWGLDVYPTAVDFTENSVSWTIYNDKMTWKAWNYLADFTGAYHLLGLVNRSTFGVNFEKQDQLYANMDPPPGSTTSWNNFPLNSPNLNYINYPRWSTWTIDPTNPFVDSAYGNSDNTLALDAYYQQEISVIPDRLSLVGTLTWRLLETTTLQSGSGNDNSNHPTLDQTLSTYLYRAGAVLQIIPRQLAVYGLVSTNTASNGTAVDINGNPLGPQQGKGTEVGLKTNLLGGRLTSTTAIYRIALSNVAVEQGVNPLTGVFYSAALAGTVQKGWDTDVEFKATKNLQFIGTFYHGTVEDQTGQPVDNSIRGTWSLFGKYDFDRSTELRGLTIGGGASEKTGWFQSTEGTFTMSPQQEAGLTANGLIRARPAVLVNVFARYRFLKHWTVNLGVDNVLNKNYATGSEDAIFVDPSPPRDFSARLTFSF